MKLTMGMFAALLFSFTALAGGKAKWSTTCDGVASGSGQEESCFEFATKAACEKAKPCYQPGADGMVKGTTCTKEACADDAEAEE